MDTKTLIQSTANIVRIVSLKPGDVYKRLHKDYDHSTPEIRIGVVTDIMHNGETAVITAVEHHKDYNGVNQAVKTFTENSNEQIFAAQPDELKIHFDEIIEVMRLKVNNAVREQKLAEQKLADALYYRNRFASGGLSITAPETEAVTQ